MHSPVNSLKTEVHQARVLNSSARQVFNEVHVVILACGFTKALKPFIMNACVIFFCLGCCRCKSVPQMTMASGASSYAPIKLVVGVDVWMRPTLVPVRVHADLRLAEHNVMVCYIWPWPSLLCRWCHIGDLFAHQLQSYLWGLLLWKGQWNYLVHGQAASKTRDAPTLCILQNSTIVLWVTHDIVCHPTSSGRQAQELSH